MKTWFLFPLVHLLWLTAAHGQAKVITTDLHNFWRAYDQLPGAKTLSDSISLFQREYFAKATPANRKFIKLRGFTAEEVVTVVKRYPRYFASIRPNASKVEEQVGVINEYLDKLTAVLPGFEVPKICFAFGCLRTGGTVANGVILIGTETVMADADTYTGELTPWIKGVIGEVHEVTPLVIHEAVHTYQKHVNTPGLIPMVMKEGFAEFVTRDILLLNNNPLLHAYGEANECSLWKSFLSDHAKGITDLSHWVYGGTTDGERPADLGYFVGRKLIAHYYDQSTDKAATLKFLANCRNYAEVFRSLTYTGGCE